MAKTNKSGTRIYYVPDFLYVYTDSYEMSPTQRISEVIPWTKQVGAPTQRISEEIPWTKQVGVEAPTERISEVIPWTKQVGVGAPTQRISEEIPWTKQVGVEANREFPKKFHGQSKLGLGRRQGTMNSILV